MRSASLRSSPTTLRGRLVVLVAFAFALLAAPAGAQTTVDTTPLVSADGIGTATLTPDIADFAATVSRLAPTSAGARTAANRRVAAVLRAAQARGVADADIATRGFSVSRERITRRGRVVRVRYRAEQTLVSSAATSPAWARCSTPIAEAGADRVGDPDFGFADPSAGRPLATRAALADARRRADDAAATQALRITGVRSVTLVTRHVRVRGRRRLGRERRERRTRRLRADADRAGRAAVHRAGSGRVHGGAAVDAPRCSANGGGAWGVARHSRPRLPHRCRSQRGTNSSAVETGRPPTLRRLPVPPRPVAQPAPGDQRRRAAAVEVHSRLAAERGHQRGQLLQRQAGVVARPPVARRPRTSAPAPAPAPRAGSGRR